ncbi:MAG: hypothetical protein JO016_01350 [Actinobacteria bacterium]|nr:hypothetical protein [Actinomycetota bacterium]
MGDHGDGLLAAGLVLAFIGGVLGARLLGAYQAMNGAKAGARAAARAMRAMRLRWLFWAVVAFAVFWLWIHGNL